MLRSRLRSLFGGRLFPLLLVAAGCRPEETQTPTQPAQIWSAINREDAPAGAQLVLAVTLDPSVEGQVGAVRAILRYDPARLHYDGQSFDQGQLTVVNDGMADRGS